VINAGNGRNIIIINISVNMVERQIIAENVEGKIFVATID
jgi:hypothetical protein